MFGVAGIPAWEPQPDVWLLIAALAAGYWIAVVRIGPRFAVPGQPVVTRFQVTCWSLGVLATWLVADWPVHVVAEQMNYSVHMVQHLTFAMVAAPLLLLGTPAWLARWIVRPTSMTFRVVRALSRFVPALVVFNVVLVVTHWPALVNESLESGPVHFALHAVLFVSSLIVWMPVLSPLPEIPRLSTPVRGIYLFSQSVVPTVPASFLTFGAAPLYHFYEGVLHLWGLSTLEDQQVAGLIMKIGAGMLLWALITVFFFRWAGDEERRQRPTNRKHLDRELAQLSPP
ncbi:MAG TPA: cytochrome c oxidase assembly protein [Acidimicrobiia bacterium]|nr:cytochrome c oxidase assembly protein [Acidimicrobiia bacterium]